MVVPLDCTYYNFLLICFQIDDLRCSSAGLFASADDSQGGTQGRLTSHLDNLTSQQSRILSQAQERRAFMEDGVAHVDKFHSSLSELIYWLTQMERVVAQAPPVSLILPCLKAQLPEQMALRREIVGKREAILQLDRDACFIQTHAQEQDVALVRNLLSSTHARWDKLLSRSSERSRQFATAFKEAQKLLTMWKELTEWLNEQLIHLDETNWTMSTNTQKLLKELAQHREFQRELGVRSGAFDATRRQLVKTRERAPRDDYSELDEMLSELKHIWNSVCSRSLDK